MIFRIYDSKRMDMYIQTIRQNQLARFRNVSWHVYIIYLFIPCRCRRGYIFTRYCRTLSNVLAKIRIKTRHQQNIPLHHIKLTHQLSFRNINLKKDRPSHRRQVVHPRPQTAKVHIPWHHIFKMEKYIQHGTQLWSLKLQMRVENQKLYYFLAADFMPWEKNMCWIAKYTKYFYSTVTGDHLCFRTRFSCALRPKNPGHRSQVLLPADCRQLWSPFYLLPRNTSHWEKNSESLLCLQLNTLRPRQNGRHFADDSFKRIFLNENSRILIKISIKFVPKGPINNNPALVQIMAWRRSGDKPLSEPMMISLLTHICVTRPQWVNKAMNTLSLLHRIVKM